MFSRHDDRMARMGLILLVLIGGSTWLFDDTMAKASSRGALLMAAKSVQVYDFTLNDIDGKALPLEQFKGKVLLIVNTASFCGNTPQYAELQTMYETLSRPRSGSARLLSASKSPAPIPTSKRFATPSTA